MDASVVAVGLIVLHAFATAVLWFELRSHEKESRERVERLTNAVLDAIALLRRDLASAGLVAGGGGGAAPAPSSGAPAPKPPVPGGGALVRRVVTVTRDDDPVHTRPTVEVPPPARLPSALAADDDRETPDEETRVARRGEAPATGERRSDRPTVFGSLQAGFNLAAPAALTGRKARPSEAPPAKVAATLPPPSKGTPEDPVEARYEALRTVARAAGSECDHCGDEATGCHHGQDPVGLCFCQCLACGVALALLVQAQREVMGDSRG